MLSPEEIAKVRSEAGAPPIEQVKTQTKSLSERLGLADMTKIKEFPQQNQSFMGIEPKMEFSGSTDQTSKPGVSGTWDIFKNIGKSMVSGAIESGKDIAAAIGAPQLQAKLDAIDEGDRKYLGTIIQLRNKAAEAQDPKKVEHYQNLIKSYKMTDGGTVADVFPEINKSTEQILGDFATLGLEVLGGGSLGTGAAKKMAGTKVGAPLMDRIIGHGLQGGKYGTAFGITSAMQENASPEGILKSGLIGGGTGMLIGGASGGLFGKGPQEELLVKEARNLEGAIGKIIQGTSEDIPAAKKALSSVDLTNVKTYKDLFGTLDNRVKVLSDNLDTKLGTKKDVIPMDKLVTTTKVGGQELKHNFVKDAVNQLHEFFTKTNDVAGKAEIEQLAKKANDVGLTVKEVNDLAKLHGQELSGYNASGELASGLTKQAAENTRAGLKGTGRQLFGDKAYETIDSELSKVINTRDLIGDVADKVTKLKQRVTERGFGEKAGRLLFQVADKITGGGLKGFVQSFVPRGEGLKIMNALDLEKGLQKNLKFVEELLGETNENTFMKKAQQFLKGTGKTLLNDSRDIPNKQGGFIKIGPTVHKEIPDATKREMMTVIDYLRQGKGGSSKMEGTLSKLAEKYGINQDWSNTKIANTFENLIDKTKTKG